MRVRLEGMRAVRVTRLDADGVPIPGTTTYLPAGLPPSQENSMNTHVAFLTGTQEGSKDERIASGTEQSCAQVLAARLLIAPGRTGYVRPLTEAELK